MDNKYEYFLNKNVRIVRKVFNKRTQQDEKLYYNGKVLDMTETNVIVHDDKSQEPVLINRSEIIEMKPQGDFR